MPFSFHSTLFEVLAKAGTISSYHVESHISKVPPAGNLSLLSLLQELFNSNSDLPKHSSVYVYHWMYKPDIYDKLPIKAENKCTKPFGIK